MPPLLEARESLSYWETRARTLPRRAVRKRREAREMAARWRERVVEAERTQYGAGLVGAALMFVAERRLPTGTSDTGRRLMRIGLWTVAATTALVLVLFVAVMAAALAIVF
jgi:hypothetical protein